LVLFVRKLNDSAGCAHRLELWPAGSINSGLPHDRITLFFFALCCFLMLCLAFRRHV